MFEAVSLIAKYLKDKFVPEALEILMSCLQNINISNDQSMNKELIIRQFEVITAIILGAEQ